MKHSYVDRSDELVEMIITKMQNISINEENKCFVQNNEEIFS